MKTTAVIAIDPEPVNSALILWDGQQIREARYAPNLEILAYLYQRDVTLPVVIEKIASYGMAVGAEVFETVFWSGRFAEAAGLLVDRIPRLDVKLHLCHDSRAKDGNVRQAILDRFGGKEVAIGKKASPGPFYGISGDLWAALAVAITWWDRHPDVHVDRESALEVAHG